MAMAMAMPRRGRIRRHSAGSSLGLMIPDLDRVWTEVLPVWGIRDAMTRIAPVKTRGLILDHRGRRDGVGVRWLPLARRRYRAGASLPRQSPSPHRVIDAWLPSKFDHWKELGNSCRLCLQSARVSISPASSSRLIVLASGISSALKEEGLSPVVFRPHPRRCRSLPVPGYRLSCSTKRPYPFANSRPRLNATASSASTAISPRHLVLSVLRRQTDKAIHARSG